MSLIREIHHSRVHSRRVNVLAHHLSVLLPFNASVLDVGAGDGQLAGRVLADRQDLRWTAVDTLARPSAHIAVQLFDGDHLPFADKTFDIALFVDVLHHTDDPLVLLREAIRVARHGILIKDHLREGFLAGPTLRVMDWVGNAGWGVRLPYNYWSAAQWESACTELRLQRRSVQRALGLYPWWADWVFGRSLHFISQFDVQGKPDVVDVLKASSD
jgi:SAM-dependent methyltransferase